VVAIPKYNTLELDNLIDGISGSTITYKGVQEGATTAINSIKEQWEAANRLGIKISKELLFVGVGVDLVIDAKVTPAGTPVVWTITPNPAGCATVDSTGKVKFTASGFAIITGTVSEEGETISAKCLVVAD